VTPIMGFAARSVRGPKLRLPSLYFVTWQQLGPARGWRPPGQIRAAITEQRTPLQRAAATVSRALTDEGLMSQEYFEEAKAGASLIAVLAPEPRLVTEARQVLAAHGARHMRFYDSKCITDLT
jgi:hypothetical protein